MTERCPFCNEPITDDTASDDHVFTEALNGRATVSACARCNNTLGSKVEGELLRNNTALNLIRQAAGFGGRPTRGTLADGTEVEHDLRTGEIRLHKPVRVERTSTTMTRTFSGSHKQVEDLLNKQPDLTPEQVAELLATAVATPITEPIQTSANLDIDLAARLAAKAALGSLRIAAGPGHVAKALADELRDVLWSRAPGTRTTVNVDGFRALDQKLAATLGQSFEPLSPPPGASQVVFMPRRDRTWIFTWVLGFQLPVLDVAAATGFAGQLPVLVRDRAGGPLVVRIQDSVLACGNDMARRSQPRSPSST